MPIKFFVIKTKTSNKQIIDLLSNSAKNGGLEIVEIDADLFNEQEFSKEYPNPGIFYRVSLGISSYTIEEILISLGHVGLNRDSVNSRIPYKNENYFLQSRGIPIPKTIFVPSKNKKMLDLQLNYLVKPPYVIKVLGGTGGIGVIKVDSKESLYGIVDFFFVNNFEFTIMEYFDFSTYGRLFVLGNSVIATKENLRQDGDFRTNEGKPVKKDFPQEICDIAVRAVAELGVEFGGVDVLLKSSGEFVVSEVNYPSSFLSTQLTSEVPISDLILSFLKNKFNKKFLREK